MSELIPIIDNLYMIDAPFFGVPLYLYVITGGDQVALIDAGINTTPDQFIFPALRKAGIKPDLLINTHGHVDHFGGNGRVRQEYPDIKIAIHNGMNQICDLTHAFVDDIDRWSLDALSQTEPRSLHTVATYVWQHMPSYEFGYHIHGSTLGHLVRHVMQGRARAVMINGHKHYLAV